MTSATFTEYLAYVAQLKGTAVTPFTEQQWDNMPAANKFGLTLLIRKSQAK